MLLANCKKQQLSLAHHTRSQVLAAFKGFCWNLRLSRIFTQASIKSGASTRFPFLLQTEKTKTDPNAQYYFSTISSVYFHYEYQLTEAVNTQLHKYAENHCIFQASFSELPNNIVSPLNIFIFWYSDKAPLHLFSHVAYILLCALLRICNCANHLILFSFRLE